MFTEAEKAMWAQPLRVRKERLTEQEIIDKYDSREQRIVTESNREKLPNFVEALKRPNHIILRPFYQRRDRWDEKRQSRLIESFIINIPVPPLFLYEVSYDRYEVMDGQQRITALQAFYSNQLRLTGLELWPELNGRTYSTLPKKIRAGIDRRSISYIAVLNESADDEEEALLLKQVVFERLNTGGVKLSRQEIRNSLYLGRMNALVLKLARHPAFAAAWGIPGPTENEADQTPDELAENKLYMSMADAEIVLRFFALRHVRYFSGGMQNFLDLFMIRSQNYSDIEFEHLERLFYETLDLGRAIYGTLLFKPYEPARRNWANRAHRAFYDAVMVGLSNQLRLREVLMQRSGEVIEETQRLFEDHPIGTFTGRANTKADIQDRIRLFEEMLIKVASRGL